MVRGCLFSILISSLISCSHVSPPSTPPKQSPAVLPCTTIEPVQVTLSASQRLNFNEGGESLATTVRIYLLKDPSKLVEASLDQFIDGDKGLLGDDLLAMKEVTLYPGEKSEQTLPRAESATTIAVVALFRRPSGPSWRVIRRLAPPDPNHCHQLEIKESNYRRAMSFWLEESHVELK